MVNDIPSQSGFEDVFIAFTLFSFRLVSHDSALNTNHIMLNMRSTTHVHYIHANMSILPNKTITYFETRYCLYARPYIYSYTTRIIHTTNM